jgi:beta-lactamase regulating signal transducer with metallopeptidase domain
MSTSALSPEDIRAAAAVHRELGPEYSDAVVASFLEKVDREIAARVEARMAGVPQARPAQRDRRRVPWTGITIAVAVAGIPLILLTQLHAQMARQMAATARGPGGTVTRVVVQSTAVHSQAAVNPGWLLLWLVVVAICVAGAVRARRRTASRRLR